MRFMFEETTGEWTGRHGPAVGKSIRWLEMWWQWKSIQQILSTSCGLVVRGTAVIIVSLVTFRCEENKQIHIR